MPTIQANKEAQGEPTFSHLWKGVCNFFTGIFIPKEEVPWKEISRQQNQEILFLQARLAERTKSEKEMFAKMEDQIEQGRRNLQDALNIYAEDNHTKRMGEIRWLVVLFQRHEELIEKHHRYTQAYEHLATKYAEVRDENEFLMTQNEGLARAKIELENCLMTERGKVAMYERAWYGSGGGP